MAAWLKLASIIGGAFLAAIIFATIILLAPHGQTGPQTQPAVQDDSTVKPASTVARQPVICYSTTNTCTSTAVSLSDNLARDENGKVYDGVPPSPYWTCSKPGAYSMPGGGIGIASGGVLSFDEFVKCGGQSAIAVKMPAVVYAKRGETARIELTLTHVASKHPLDSVSFHAIGMPGTGFIPASSANLTTPEERVKALQKTGHIPGAIDLDPTVSVRPTQFTLRPGESAHAVMEITLPKDMADDAVGNTIWYTYGFASEKDYDYGVLFIQPPTFEVKVAG